jgi:hypothetical protein
MTAQAIYIRSFAHTFALCATVAVTLRDFAGAHRMLAPGVRQLCLQTFRQICHLVSPDIGRERIEVRSVIRNMLRLDTVLRLRSLLSCVFRHMSRITSARAKCTWDYIEQVKCQCLKRIARSPKSWWERSSVIEANVVIQSCKART